MSFNKTKLYLLFFFLIFHLCYVVAKDDYRIEPQPFAQQILYDLPASGTLKQKENGFIYLDVSNDFITEIIPLLDHEGIIRPRPTASRSMGAHISVFHEQEQVVPEELGMNFNFAVKDIRSFTMHTRDGLKKLWVIAIESQELEDLRQKYGLKPLLKGYSFHITLGKQMPSAPEGWQLNEDVSPFDLMDSPVDPMFSSGDFITVESDQFIKTAQKVNAIGQLKLKGNGFVYLDVDNSFVDLFENHVAVSDNFKATSTKPKKMGAHVSVIYEDEMIKNEIWDFIEAGQWFNFEVKDLRYVDRKTSSGLSRLWLLAVNSPGLQRLRDHYGLSSKLKRHDFHITLGSESLESSSAEVFNMKFDSHQELDQSDNFNEGDAV